MNIEIVGRTATVVPFVITVQKRHHGKDAKLVSLMLKEDKVELVNIIEQVGDFPMYLCASKLDSSLQSVMPIYQSLPAAEDVVSIMTANEHYVGKFILRAWYLSELIN